MNLFFYGQPFEVSLLCDAHVTKMLTETVQILYTVLIKFYGLTITGPVPTHKGDQDPWLPVNQHTHQCVLWAAACHPHFSATLMHAQALREEHRFRSQLARPHMPVKHASADHLSFLEHQLQSLDLSAMPSHAISRDEFEQWMLNNVGMSPDKVAAKITSVATGQAPAGCQFGVVAVGWDKPFHPDQPVVDYTVYDDSGNIMLNDTYRANLCFKAVFRFACKWRGKPKLPPALACWLTHIGCNKHRPIMTPEKWRVHCHNERARREDRKRKRADKVVEWS